MEKLTTVAAVGLISSILGVLVAYGTLVERSTRIPVMVHTLSEGQRHISDNLNRLEKRIDRLEEKIDQLTKQTASYGK